MKVPLNYDTGNCEFMEVNSHELAKEMRAYIKREESNK